MKKIFNCMILLAAVSASVCTLTSCNDDDDLTKADALFRPVINETDNVKHGLTADYVPYMIVNWDNYTDANRYVVGIEATDGSDTRTVETDTTTYRFDGLQYDKEYNITLQAKSTISGLESKAFSLTTTSLDYPTMLSTPSASDIIDIAARIRWAEGTVYDKLEVYKDSNDSLISVINLNSTQLAELAAIVSNLSPKTTYKVVAYQNGAYRGKKRFTTAASESFSGAVIDLRDVVDSIAKNFITTDQIAADVAANAGKDVTYVLKGGFDYKVSGGTALPSTTNSIRFVTGLTLEGNARFLQSGGFTMAAEADINAVTFEKIDFVSDKVNNGSNPVDSNHDKGWGGRQVFNVNNTKATMKNLTYRNCSFTGYRAVCRAQNASDAVNHILMEGCLINCIGDQGVITTTNKAADWQSVTMRNCTITNIVLLCDLRATAGTLDFNIENCTFCYAPIETTSNANTPLFRLGSGNVNLNMKNTLVGPSMKTTDSAGDEIWTYEAGTAGSILLSGTPNNLVVEDSYKTNFSWTDLGADGEVKVYPLEGIGELSLDETKLWSNPSKGVFNIIGSQTGVDFKTLGDSRWW